MIVRHPRAAVLSVVFGVCLTAMFVLMWQHGLMVRLESNGLSEVVEKGINGLLRQLGLPPFPFV